MFDSKSCFIVTILKHILINIYDKSCIIHGIFKDSSKWCGHIESESQVAVQCKQQTYFKEKRLKTFSGIVSNSVVRVGEFRDDIDSVIPSHRSIRNSSGSSGHLMSIHPWVKKKRDRLSLWNLRCNMWECIDIKCYKVTLIMINAGLCWRNQSCPGHHCLYCHRTELLWNRRNRIILISIFLI